MTQALFHASKQFLLVTRLGINHTVGSKARLCDRGREQILMRDAPHHASSGSGRDPGSEQCRSRPINRSVAAARNFVQSAKGKSATG